MPPQYPEVEGRLDSGWRRSGTSRWTREDSDRPPRPGAMCRAAVTYLIQEGGRYAQGVRDVVEAFHLDVLRQHVLRVHVHAHQGLHPCGVPSVRFRRWIGRWPAFGPLALESSVPSIHATNDLNILLRRLRTAWRRHQIAAQLAQRLLPDLGVVCFPQRRISRSRAVISSALRLRRRRVESRAARESR